MSFQITARLTTACPRRPITELLMHVGWGSG